MKAQNLFLKFTALILTSCLISCEDPAGLAGLTTTQAPPEFTENPEAVAAFNRMTDGASRFPSSHELVREVNSPGVVTGTECIREEERVAGDALDARGGRYNVQNEEQRRNLIRQIIEAGPDSMGTTIVNIDGRRYEVMNDNVTLPDGTYVPLTFPEAQEIARAWGYQLPTEGQAQAIGRYARENGTQFTARTYLPNDRAQRYLNMNNMMNDNNMHSRAQSGRRGLIDGHFKWYTDRGGIIGFANGTGGFYHNRASGAHSSDPSYYDYSHGVRLIRPL